MSCLSLMEEAGVPREGGGERFGAIGSACTRSSLFSTSYAEPVSVALEKEAPPPCLPSRAHESGSPGLALTACWWVIGQDCRPQSGRWEWLRPSCPFLPRPQPRRASSPRARFPEMKRKKKLMMSPRSFLQPCWHSCSLGAVPWARPGALPWPTIPEPGSIPGSPCPAFSLAIPLHLL